MKKFDLIRKSPDLIEIYCGTKFVGEFVMDLDGFYVYFPNKLNEGYVGGGMSEMFLESLISEMKKINEPWKKTIEDFFQTKKPLEIQDEFGF